jgi:4'-phosphopantetheinyl transferase EntD
MIHSIEKLLPENLVVESQEVINYSSNLNIKEIASAEEIKIIHGSTVKRFNEFIAGRTCCKRCLNRMSISDFPVLKDKFGLPVFPDHIVGSISHTKSIGIAITGKKEEYKALGIDVEEIGRIKKQHIGIFTTQEELNFLIQLSGFKQEAYSTLIFSAKEACHKLMFSISKNILDFKNINISVTGSNSFTVRMLKKSNGYFTSETMLTGIYSLSKKYIITTIFIKA